MERLIIEVELSANPDLDRQDILDQLSRIISEHYGSDNQIEFLDAWLSEREGVIAI